LPARPVERLPEVILGHRRGSGCALQQKQLAFDAQQLGNRPAFFGALRACVRLLDHDEPVGDLPGTARGFRPSSRSFITSVNLARSIPAVLVTAYSGNGVRERELSAGGIGPLNKPLKEDDPLACVRSALTSARNGRR
jgi:CheY-like chemotaxis protein